MNRRLLALGAGVLLAAVAVYASLSLTPLAAVIEYGDVSSEQAAALIKVKPQLAILDVRTKAEYDAGHLKGAILVPVAELADRLSEVPMDRDILVYCRTGNRSRTAMEVLRQNGYTRLYHLKDGVTDWILKGYPVE